MRIPLLKRAAIRPYGIARLCCLALALFAAKPALAEDIDLFAGGGNLAIPNLFIIVDNTANWGASFPAPTTPQNCGSTAQQRATRYCAIKTALYGAINGLNTSGGGKIRIGLMFFNYNNGVANPSVAPTTSATGRSDGAFVRYAVQEMNATNKANLLAIIDGLDKTNDQGVGSAQNAVALEEARRYFGGLSVINGNNTYWGMPTGPQVLDLSATDSATHATYVSPVGQACSQNFILYINNGPPASSDESTAAPLITTYNNGTLPPMLAWPSTVNTSWQSNWMDEYAQLMYKTDSLPSLSGFQNLITFGVALRDPNSQTDNQASAVSARYLVQNAAQHGGGKYFETTSTTQLQNRLAAILAEIQSVPNVFVSATLPVALNISNTYLNQVYMGLFRPDAKVAPRWYGNLKHYKLAYDAGTEGLSLVDARDRDVVSTTTGYVVPTARSIWSHNPTTSTASGGGSVDFWLNAPRGTPLPTTTDLPDGEVVEKGGVAQQMREQYLINAPITGAASASDRNVLTCNVEVGCGTTCGATLAKFDLASVSSTNGGCQSKFNATNSTDLANLVNWVRGINNAGDEAGPGNTSTGYATNVRGSIHGDVLHSRPLIVDYGGTNGIVAFYGGNDGMLHAVCVGVAGATCGSKTAGQELWAFVAPDHFAKFKRLRDQSPIIWMPNIDYSSVTPLPQRRDYFFDGGIAAYQTPSRTVIYATGRRGGNFIYAIDVTNPASPSLVWKVDNTTTGFSKLAQTWSTPQVGYVRARGKSNPVLFFGAGYCGGYSGYTGTKPNGVGEDSDGSATSSPSCPVTADGRGVYVVDLGANATSTTPSVINLFTATYDNAATIADSVAADVTVLDRDGDGYVDRVYAADTGGTLWRMDVDDASPANWKLFKFAVAKQIADGSGQREKFFYRPDVVPTKSFDAVLIGSGNREEPLATTTNNRFYMFKDFKTGKNAAASPALATITNYSNMLNAATATSAELTAAMSDATKTGWYLPLLTDGEKVVNAPLTLAGTVYFATNRPNASLPVDLTCSNLGEARAYRISFASGVSAGTTSFLTGGGLPPSPTAGVVQVGGELVPFCIGCGPSANTPAYVPPSGTSPIDPTKIFVTPPNERRKTYWYNNIDQ
jgi:type IV pilus assembly protein PilY1